MLTPACARTHYLIGTEPALGGQRPNSLATLLCVTKFLRSVPGMLESIA
jgi:hypothetical protein